jgi:hypothetical protein
MGRFLHHEAGTIHLGHVVLRVILVFLLLDVPLITRSRVLSQEHGPGNQIVEFG